MAVISETQIYSKIEFFLYVTADGVEELKIGPLNLKFPCLMNSSPPIYVPNNFERDQVFKLASPNTIPYFNFKPFESGCSNFPPMIYNISTNSTEVV